MWSINRSIAGDEDIVIETKLGDIVEITDRMTFAVDNHIIGNGMRLDETSEVNLDERWKSVLIEEELRVFNRIAGGFAQRYGYA